MQTIGRAEERLRCACAVCGRSFRRSQLVPAALVRPALAETIAREVPDWHQDSMICHADLNRFRGSHVERMLERELGELSELERSVVERISEREMLATNVDAKLDRAETLGERATHGGSRASGAGA